MMKTSKDIKQSLCFTQFKSQMKNHLTKISLSPDDVQARKQLIQYLRCKLKNKFYTDNTTNPLYHQDYTGIDLEVYGSYAAGLSTNESDLDLRINDFYSYRWLNLQTIANNLEYMAEEYDGNEDSNKRPDYWTGPKSNKKRSRLIVTEYLKFSKVPILKMLDRKTKINIDISQGSSCVNNRHISICRRSQKHYPNLKNLILCLKSYLTKCGCHWSYQGGISSFLLFYMVLAFYQNYEEIYKDHIIDAPDIVKFLQFYTFFDENKFGIQIDLSQVFPDEYYKKDFQKITCNPITTKNPEIIMDCLYIKDPIGKIYYSDPSEYHLYRDNAGQSAFEYVSRVKPQFANSFHNIMSGIYNIPCQIDNQKNQQIDYWRFMEDNKKENEEKILPKSPEKQQISSNKSIIIMERSPLEMNVDEIEEQIIHNWDAPDSKEELISDEENQMICTLKQNQHQVEKELKDKQMAENKIVQNSLKDSKIKNIMEFCSKPQIQKEQIEHEIVEIDLEDITRGVMNQTKKAQRYNRDSRSKKHDKKQKPKLANKSSKQEIQSNQEKEVVIIRKKQVNKEIMKKLDKENKFKNSKEFKASLFKEILDQMESDKKSKTRL